MILDPTDGSARLGRMKRPLLIALPALALAACGAPAENVTGNVTEPFGNEVNVIPESDAPVLVDGDDGIPGSLRGRWGINEADCDPERADNKGLIDVSDTSVTFYESRAELVAIEASGNDMVRALFTFTGEGMTWERDMSLTLEESGNALVRREYGEGAMEVPQTYRRCTA